MPSPISEGQRVSQLLLDTAEVIDLERPLRARHEIEHGESIELTTPEGVRKFPIAGIFYDYTRDQGIVFMSARNFIQFWHDDRVNSVAVYLKKTGSGETLSEAFRREFSLNSQFVIYSNRSLRTRIFEIFDQTFAVTYVLRTIAVVVAITGIFLSLTILITERSRELAIVRAIGGSAAQIRRLLLWETAMLGLLAALIGVASGLCLSLVLTGVINRAFFGWTIRLAFPWRSLALTPFWIFGAAVVAGILPDKKRGLAFGLFYAGYGFGWLIGSVAVGLLYQQSRPALVMFAVAAQLCSLPFFILGNRHQRARLKYI